MPKHIILPLIYFITVNLSIFSQEKKIKIQNKTMTPSEVGIYDTDLLPASFHKERREKLRELMPKNSATILFSSPIRNRSNDMDYEYHQDRNFLYLTGLNEPHSVVVIFKEKQLINGVYTNEIIFVRPRDVSKELWLGKRIGVEGAKQLLEFKTVFENKKFKKILSSLPSTLQVFSQEENNDTRENKTKGSLYQLKKESSKWISTTEKKVSSFNLWMAQLRQIKTEGELQLMRKAITITCKSQIELMKRLDTTMKEFQTEALVEFHFKNEGAEHAGFPTIHGSGENSCILHYMENRKPLHNKELLVSDIGAEYHGYTADVTRTIPVNGKYSKEQEIIYNIVLEAQSAGIKACKEGNSFWEPGKIAKKIIAKRLMELGIIKNEWEVKKYFPHGTSHYLGLDVHDTGLYQELKAGQVITVEPGIYIPEGSDCDPKWWNIGIRIEDDILITKEKPENLSDCVPRTIPEIELIMKQK